MGVATAQDFVRIDTSHVDDALGRVLSRLHIADLSGTPQQVGYKAKAFLIKAFKEEFGLDVNPTEPKEQIDVAKDAAANQSVRRARTVVTKPVQKSPPRPLADKRKKSVVQPKGRVAAPPKAKAPAGKGGGKRRGMEPVRDVHVADAPSPRRKRQHG